MLRILLAFASGEGQTEKIAHHLARRLEDRGSAVLLIDLKADVVPEGVEGYDAAIVAGSIHAGEFHPELIAFLDHMHAALDRIPTLFLSVSLTAASHEDSDRAALDAIVARLEQRTLWHPEMVEHVAGAVHDRRLGFVKRAILHAILRSKGVMPSPTGDTELTDWLAVEAAVDAFADRVRSAKGMTDPPTSVPSVRSP